MIGKKYEWWYLHVASPKLGISLVLHQTDIFGDSYQPYMSMSFSRGNGHRSYFKRALDRSPEEHNGKPRIPEIIFEAGDDIQISCEFEGASLTGRFVQVGKELVINDGLLYEHPTGKRSYWITCFPRAYFHGVLKEYGNNISVHGFAYCDHQYGDIGIQEFVDRWVWGVYSNEDRTLGFFKILTRQNVVIDRGFWSSGMEHRSTMSLKDTSIKKMSRIDQHALSDHEPRISVLGEDLHIIITSKNVVRERLGERHLAFSFDYLRWFGQANANSTGFAEFMRFRKGGR